MISNLSLHFTDDIKGKYTFGFYLLKHHAKTLTLKSSFSHRTIAESTPVCVPEGAYKSAICLVVPKVIAP